MASEVPRTTTDGAWEEYINSQMPPEPDDDFEVVKREQESAERTINPAFSRNPEATSFSWWLFTDSDS